jgi:hypothetical protein
MGGNITVVDEVDGIGAGDFWITFVASGGVADFVGVGFPGGAIGALEQGWIVRKFAGFRVYGLE